MINPLISQMKEDVMGFLNEVQLKYPDAITFASGRPPERFFDITNYPQQVEQFVNYLAGKYDKDKQAIWNSLGQYNRAKGIVNELVAGYLKNDEGIQVGPGAVVMTVGNQEAMVLAVLALCVREKDVILVEDPSYIGITHFASLAGYQMAPVPVDNGGMRMDRLEQQVLRLRQYGKRVKLVYVIPDFQNPGGVTMPYERRVALLALASKYNFFILEDNAYGEFRYSGNAVPPLKTLDREKRVIYMRSFSKTVYPALRLGALVADQLVEENGSRVLLSDVMAKVKGYVTVNTPSLSQAIFGGILIQHGSTLKAFNEHKIGELKRRLDHLLASLEEQFGAARKTGEVSWNIPEGGFFLRMTFPFKVNKEEVMRCAERFGVIITPMSFFYQISGGEHEIRIAFSNVDEQQISEGTERLFQYFQYKSNQIIAPSYGNKE